MKKLVKDKFRKPGRRNHSLVYPLTTLLFLCTLVAGMAAITRPWQPITASAMGQATSGGKSTSTNTQSSTEGISADGVWLNLDQAMLVNGQSPRPGGPRSFRTLGLSQSALGS